MARSLTYLSPCEKFFTPHKIAYNTYAPGRLYINVHVDTFMFIFSFSRKAVGDTGAFCPLKVPSLFFSYYIVKDFLSRRGVKDKCHTLYFFS